MRVERLPFTVYDVLGYFVPGFMLLIGMTHFVPTIGHTIEAHKALLGDSFSGHAVEIAFVIAMSYALGHIVSLTAGKTVEVAVVKLVGYPSEYLLYDRDFRRRWYHPRELGKHAQARVRERFEKEFKVDLSNCEKQEWFSLIDHYLRSNNPQIALRMYNYVVLYGFLRNTAFVFFALGCASFMRITVWPPNVSWSLPVGLFIFGLSASFGFQKYYRRYSSEALMGFAVCNSAESKDTATKSDTT